jgi:hypothetical protein
LEDEEEEKKMDEEEQKEDEIRIGNMMKKKLIRKLELSYCNTLNSSMRKYEAGVVISDNKFP